ncbi:acylneuraminate cytidylyltransferase family protein [Flavobacteriaceae bacterium]|nr:acylneuraminate cytidylyltransferase family protein [Flavobacteriaceae bacterium]
MKKYKNIAFIPARSGSKRIKDKNIKKLSGKPLLSYTVESALNSGFYSKVFIVTDSEKYAKIATSFGAELLKLRPSNISGDNSPDIEWVKWMFNILEEKKIEFDTFSILRPTSPFRTKNTYIRAFNLFFSNTNIHSLRAVELVDQHPGKMWVTTDDTMVPLLPFKNNNVPWHSNQKSLLPKIYIQNASFEIAWKDTVVKYDSISGSIVVPFISLKNEGFDINEPIDFKNAEKIINK